MHSRLCRAAVVLPLLALLPVPPGEAAEPVALRIMAANISSGRFQSYPEPGPGTRIFRALRPDIVLIQEFNVNATRNGPNDFDAVDRWVSAVFGPDYHWVREPGNDSIPNGVISRWPILESGEWRDEKASNRDFAFARIDLPGDTDLWAVSLHLLTRRASVRGREARALVEAIKRHPVPDEDYLVIGGDFNTNHRREPAVTTLGELVDILGPFPHDGADPPDGDTNSRRRKPYDWVLADAELEALAVSTEIDDFLFPLGLVFDSRLFTRDELAESFPPVLPGDSGAPQMQHMAVVRDFLLRLAEPTDLPDLEIEPSSIDFGLVAARNGPLDVVLDGTHASEFRLLAPDLATAPDPGAPLDDGSKLEFSWTPSANDGEPRRVTATLITDGEPGAVEIVLFGRVQGPGTAAPLEIAGFRVEQTGGEAAIAFPAGTALEPGAIVVVGRQATRSEFEAFWGQLPSRVLYVNGSELSGPPGFPIVNGGERFRLVDPAGVAVDPLGTRVPSDGRTRGVARQRRSTDSTDFSVVQDPLRDATPGRFLGTRAGTGRLVLTEVSDALGPGSFRFEFVELLFDAR